MSKGTDVKPRKKGNKCCSCLLAIVITLLVIVLAACAIGLGVADNYLKTNYTVGVGDCFQAISGLLNADSKNILTDPATEEDNDALYSELRKTLFLNDNVDLEGVVVNALNNVIDSKPENIQRLQSSDGNSQSENDDASSEIIGFIGDLYKEGNIDLTRLRKYINGSIDIGSVYDSEFTVSIEGNYLVGLINIVLNSVLENNENIADFVGKISAKQLGLGRNEEGAYLKLVAEVELRTIVGEMIEKEEISAPDFTLSLVKSIIPEYSYVAATIGLWENATMSLAINNVTESTMRQMYKLIYGISGTDVEKELNNVAKSVVEELKTSASIVLDILSSVDSYGKINMDVYGFVADILNEEFKKEDSSAEKPSLTGLQIAKFLVGVLGSDEQAAIEARIAEDSRYGAENWQAENVAALVETMADSFSLAKNYFVNGTDENGNKIISIENGVVVGIDKLIGRVYSDAFGNIYYKRSGSQFKIFISDDNDFKDKKVSRYAQSGYNAFYSLDLHYNYDGSDYTLYRSEDKRAIYGVCGDKVTDKNGTYTELTTLYVDSEGNVYSDNVQAELIQITKEKLNVDAIFNILEKDDMNVEDILDFVDLSALRVNGMAQWKEPIKISDIQLIALVGEMINDYLTEDMKSLNPTIGYASIKKSNNSDILTIGLNVEITDLLDGNLKPFASVIGEKLYFELEADVALGKNSNEYLPIKVRLNDLDHNFTSDILDTIDMLVSDMNLVGSLENVARSLRETLSELNQKISVTIGDGEITLESPARIVSKLLSTENEIDPELLIDTMDLLLRSDADAATEAVKAKYPIYAGENWRIDGINGFVEVFADAFVLNKEKFKADDGVNYSIDKIVDILTSETGMTVDSVMSLLDYDVMTTEGLGTWKNSFCISDAQLAAAVDYLKDGYLQNIDAEIADLEIEEKNGKAFLSLGVKVNVSDLIHGNSSFNRIIGVIGDEIYAKVTMDVTIGATSYSETKIAFNDLTVAETQTVLDLLQNIQSDLSLNDKISNVESEIRKLIEQLNQSVGIEFLDGQLKFNAPQEMIYGLLMKDSSTDFDAEDMTDALSSLLTSSVDSAIDDVKKENSAFADSDWRIKGVNSFAEKFTDAYILKKSEFKLGNDYSLSKIIDIMENGTGDVEEFSRLLDYDVMTTDGFGAWKSELTATDVELAAIIESVKDEYLGSYSDMNVAVEYVRIFTLNGKNYICLGVSLDTEKLIGNKADDIAAIIDALGDRMYVQMTVDVTVGAQVYDSPKIVLNDLSETETEEILRLLGCISSDLNKENLFGEISDSIREMIDSIASNLTVKANDGYLSLGCAQDVVFNTLVSTPKNGLTSSEMTDALTALSVCGTDYAQANNNFVVDTSKDVQSESFWNEILKTKYFINSDIKTLFGIFASGENSSTALLDAIDANLFVDENGKYLHNGLNDQNYTADNEKLSWLFRANSSVMTSLFDNDTFANIEIYKTEIVNNGGKAKVKMIIVLPSSSLISAMGNLGTGTSEIITNLLGEKLGVEISWTANTDVAYSLNGMTDEQSAKLNKLIYSITGVDLLGEDSDVYEAATIARDYFCEYFHYEIIDGNGAAWMDYFYYVLQGNVFPVVANKQEITADDVYELMKTLYERPLTNGVFDSSKVGYESNAATVALIGQHVKSDLYTTVGALQNLNISLFAPVAKLKATVKYDITGLGGYALKALPQNVFITADYDANPVVNGFSISIDESTVSARFNTATDNSALIKCLAYLGVDINGAVEMAHEQLDGYIRSCLSVVM